MNNNSKYPVKKNNNNKIEVQYRLRRKRSMIPYAMTAGFLALYALIISFSAWFHFVFAGGCAVLLYTVTNRIFPPVEVKIPVKNKRLPSGNIETEKLLTSGEDYLKTSEDSMTKIAVFNRSFADDIASVLAYGYKINNYIAENPDKRQTLGRYYNYYLPQLDKLLKAYLTFRRHGLDGRSATESMLEIEDAVRAMQSAFASQLDKLLFDMTLDITTDIEVLEGLLSETTGNNPK